MKQTAGMAIVILAVEANYANLKTLILLLVFWKIQAKNDNDCLIKSVKEGRAGELVELVKDTFSQFLNDVQTKRVQAAIFESVKENKPTIL